MIRANNWTLFLLVPDLRELRLDLVAGLQNHSLPAVRIKAGAGTAVYPQGADSKKALLRLADASMYRSKAGGKNRVTVA